MPKYDYICYNVDCETKTFEILTTSFEENIARCPGCKEKTQDKKSVDQFSFTMD